MPSKTPLSERLQKFSKDKGFLGKGALCVALVVTRKATREGLPLNPDKLMTSGEGQVAGLGKAEVQAILADYKITRVLAEEGGRTSRGSIGKMRAYVEFLNELSAPVDFKGIERYWIERVREFFAGKPFKLRVENSLSLRAAIRDLLRQAGTRQGEIRGTRYEGTMLQHLVGAKLELVMPPDSLIHHSAAEADEAEGRAGDFVLGDVALHVTTHPGEALMRKCAANIEAGLRPLIVTLPKRIAVADGLADTAGIADQIELLDIEQFLASNLHERGLFQTDQRRQRTCELIDNYNRLIDAHETDPALRIEIIGR